MLIETGRGRINYASITRTRRSRIGTGAQSEGGARTGPRSRTRERPLERKRTRTRPRTRTRSREREHDRAQERTRRDERMGRMVERAIQDVDRILRIPTRMPVALAEQKSSEISLIGPAPLTGVRNQIGFEFTPRVKKGFNA